MKSLTAFFIVLLAASTGLAQQPERSINAQILIEASPDAVWNAWTTESGIKSFFAPGCRVEPRVGGHFEIYFNPTGEAGTRGAEGTRILAFQPTQMLAFTWNNPPTIPNIRWQYTSIVVRLKPVGTNKTMVTLNQSGFGEGQDWDQAFSYFSQAWSKRVLPYLKLSLEAGPIDWKNPPKI